MLLRKITIMQELSEFTAIELLLKIQARKDAFFIAC
jgi:hypothetical protein